MFLLSCFIRPWKPEDRKKGRHKCGEEGFFEAEKMLVKENNTLYQSLIGKLADYPELKTVVYNLLFTGKPIPYVSTNNYIEIAEMFGFFKNKDDMAVISNRIFESVLYNFFISEEFADSKMYNAGVQEIVLGDKVLIEAVV